MKKLQMTVVFFGVLLVAINLCAVLNVFYWQFGKKERIRRVILPSVMLEPSLPQQPEPGSEVVISCAANNIFGQYKCQQEQKTLIYVVTPTYPRREQHAELTRMAQTLLHVKHMFWIIAEDSYTCSDPLLHLLMRYDIPFVYMATPKPSIYDSFASYRAPKGVAARNAAIDWIMARHRNSTCHRSAVMYFADDDNVYDLRVFEEARSVTRVGVWPVGLVGIYSFSSPVVKNDAGNGTFHVVGFIDPWFGKRKFPLDMAGFAVSVDYMLKQEAKGHRIFMTYWNGHEEDSFLQSIGTELSDLEPKADNCQEVLVWHTKTKKAQIPLLNFKYIDQVNNENLQGLVDDLQKKGMVTVDPEIGLEVLACFKPGGCQ